MKVLLATEGSKFSEAALDKCCELFAQMNDTEIRVLVVMEPTFVTAQPFAVFPNYVGEADAQAEAAAEKIAHEANSAILTRLPSIGSGLTSRITVGRAEQVIVEEAETWGADLIIVGSHGAGFWERSLLGSVSSGVVHHAPCSVLVVRPPLSQNGN